MSATFASQEWADSLAVHLHDSAAVRTESISWVHGPLLLVIDADVEHGVESVGVRIDLHEGSVRSVTLVPAEDARLCPFAVGGSIARWKAVFVDRSLSLVDGVLESRLRLRGDLPTFARHRGLLDAVAVAAAGIETIWQDELEPAAAPA